MAKLIFLLRVKDSMFFINEWLERYKDLGDGIVALDNGSTDGTLEVLKNHPAVLEVVRTEGYNEGRDKNLLYNTARKYKPDWLMWLDVDEILEPQITRKHFDKMMSSKLFDRFAFRRFHFIDRQHFAGSQFWLNYSAGHDRILWREKPSGYFLNLILDSPNVKGIGGIKAYTSYRLKHLGYINKTLVDRKANTYNDLLNGDKSIIRTMYIADEKKMRWIDDRNDIKVIGLNALLNALLIKHFVQKIMKKVGDHFSGIVKRIDRLPQTMHKTAQ